MKPIVFLSHGARDADAVLRLKQSLLSATKEAVEFFLSSDGTSIPPGSIWSNQIFSALSNAKLLYVFLSPNSLESQWIFFEAGMAHDREIPVVPVGLYGVKVGELPPPLGLFHGFDLNSSLGFERLVDTLNMHLHTGYRLPSSGDVYDAFVGSMPPALGDGEYDFRVFARSAGGETAHELLHVVVHHPNMTVSTGTWDSAGTITENRFVGRFKLRRGYSPDHVGMHDFIWDGNEFVGSAKLDSGKWFAEDLIWRPVK